VGSRWVGVAEETTFGTEVTTPTLSMRVLDLDLNPDQQRILEYESNSRMKEFSLLGPFIGSGRLTAWARPDTIGYFLKWLTGNVTSSQIGSSAAYQHTFKLADAIKSFTLTDNRGLSGVNSRACIGCLVKSMTIEAPARGVVSYELDIQYTWEKLVSAPTKGTLSSLRPFLWSDASVSLGGETVGKAESLRFVWTNSIPDDVHNLGSRKIEDIILEGVEVTMEMDLKFTNWDMRELFYGAEDSTEPQSEEGTFAFNAVFTGESTGESESGAEYYELELNFPKVVVKENPAPISRRDRLTQRVTLEALLDDNNYIKLINKTVSY